MMDLTQGQTILTVISLLIVAIIIGEFMYRLKRWKMRKENDHLSDYGIDQCIDRIDFYVAGIASLLILLFIVGIVCSIIRLWNIPF